MRTSFTALFSVLTSCIVLHTQDVRGTDQFHPEFFRQSSLVCTAVILQRHDVWDRRSRDMGRPDILKEITLELSVTAVHKGPLPSGVRIIVSITGEKNIIAYKRLARNERGTVYLSGDRSPYSLICFLSSGVPAATNSPVLDRTATRAATNMVTEKQGDAHLRDPENISGRMIMDSASLREQTAQIIAKKYGLSNAIVVTRVSFSGPMPPEGGYILWGVRGQIGSNWYLWEPGAKGKLRPGTELIDPHRYQKCCSPNSMIMTPSGPLPIVRLKVGDMVLSDGGKPFPVIRTQQVRAEEHMMYRMTFDDGTVLEISPEHPLADGSMFGDHRSGERMGGKRIVAMGLFLNQHQYTYDILPDSPSGTYCANDIWLKSTIARD